LEIATLITVTLDTNCIIKATKPDENDHELITRLIGMHKQGAVEIRVVAASAMENKRDLEQLLAELENLKLKGIKILPAPMIAGLSYLGYTYAPDKNMLSKLEDVWNITFPSNPFEHSEFCKKRKSEIPDDSDIDRRWRNHMCDAITVFEYVRNIRANSRNILVTADGDDILKKATQLEKIGTEKIYGVAEAVEVIAKLINDMAKKNLLI
jgi:hypothetical protein